MITEEQEDGNAVMNANERNNEEVEITKEGRIDESLETVASSRSTSSHDLTIATDEEDDGAAVEGDKAGNTNHIEVEWDEEATAETTAESHCDDDTMATVEVPDGNADYLRDELYKRLREEPALLNWLHTSVTNGIFYWDLEVRVHVVVIH